MALPCRSSRTTLLVIVTSLVLLLLAAQNFEVTRNSTSWSGVVLRVATSAEATASLEAVSSSDSIVPSRRHSSVAHQHAAELPWPLSDVEISWQGGGVLGPARQEILQHLSNLARQSIDAVTAKNTSACRAVSDPYTLQKLLHHLSTSILLSVVNDTDDDCIYHLVPHHRALCTLLYLMDSEGDALASIRRYVEANLTEAAQVRRKATGAKVDSGPPPKEIWSSFFPHSLCHEFLACMDWNRGRIGLKQRSTPSASPGSAAFPILPQHLEAVYETQVRPVVEQLRGATGDVIRSSLLHNFLHGEGHWAEIRYLEPRGASMLYDIEKRDRIAAWKLGLDAARETGKRYPLAGPGTRINPRNRKPTPVLEVFQEHVIGFDTNERESWFAYPGDAETGQPSRSVAFSPLQMLALLHHRNQRNRQLSRRRDNSLELIVFQGDSTVRELYARLIHHVRYGLSTTLDDDKIIVVTRNGGESAEVKQESFAGRRIRRPFYDRPYHSDSIYSVYPTYDELLIFGNESDAATNASVPKFQVTLDRLYSHPAGRDGHPALLHVVFLWDPKSDSYRHEPLAPVTGPSAQVQVQWNQTTFRERGYGISLHVQGATQWEAKREERMLNHWAAMLSSAGGQSVAAVASALQDDNVAVFSGLKNITEGLRGLLVGSLAPSTALQQRRPTSSSSNHRISSPAPRDHTLLYMMTGYFEDRLSFYQLQHVSPPRVWRRASRPLQWYHPEDPRHEQVVAKNEQHFRWATQVDQLRSLMRNHTHRAHDFVQRFLLLDKAKLPYLPQLKFHDRFHMSCRCDKVYFDHIFRPTITVKRMFLLTSTALHPNPIVQWGASGDPGFARDVWEYDVCQEVGTSMIQPGRFQVLELLRKAEWALARHRNQFYQLMHRSSKRGHNGLLFHGGKEYCGVVESLDGCADHPDFGLLQVVLMDVALQG